MAELTQSISIEGQKPLDDFTQITGIGPGIEKRLKQAGLLTYRQLAGQSAADLFQILKSMPGISIDRLIEQDWTGQARALASDKVPDQQPELSQEISQQRQRYENFMVELLVDESSQVRRTRITHVMTKNEQSWAGWDQARLIHFIEEQSMLERLGSLPSYSEESPQLVPFPEQIPVTPWPVEPPQRSTTETRLGIGIPRVLSFSTQPANLLESSSVLYADEPFNVAITLDFSKSGDPDTVPLAYAATLYAKGLGNIPSQELGTIRSFVIPSARATIGLQDARLERGSYRLEAIVSFASSSHQDPSDSERVQFIEGGILNVFDQPS